MSESQNVYQFFKNEKANKGYNNEIVRKTWHYQKIYNFEVRGKKGNEFWNNEADAFKHTFMSADLYFKYGKRASLAAGIYHEYETPNNPFGEWNMDSWNNNQGRQIAEEMEKVYGKIRLQNMPQQERDNILAKKIMERMCSGQLITSPDDKRLYTGWIENECRKNPGIIDKLIEITGKVEEYGGNISAEANKMSENLKRIIKEHEEETRRTFEENLEKLNLRNGNPIEKYEKLKREDRVFHQGDIPQIAKKASKDITQEELEDYKEFVKQWSRNGNKIPTQAELDESVARGELIWVDGYTKQDGTVVRGYFRHYPETA